MKRGRRSRKLRQPGVLLRAFAHDLIATAPMTSSRRSSSNQSSRYPKKRCEVLGSWTDLDAEPAAGAGGTSAAFEEGESVRIVLDRTGGEPG